MARYSKTERVGVNAAEKLFLEDLEMIFREQPIVDMGIDAHVESVENGNPTGKLIAVQIKTGESYFTFNDDHMVFYGDNVHLEYWLNHSLPVILVAHLPERDKTYWQRIDKTTIEKTPKAWKVKIPFIQELGASSKSHLLSILSDTSTQHKTNKLLLDKDLMLHISNGGKINVYTEEWLHKSLGRGPFQVIIIKEDGEEVEREWKAFYTGELIEVLQHSFPWADFENDEDFYANNFDANSVYSMFNKNHINENVIYPYEVVQGEAGLYRVNLRLNKIGKAFLTMQEYLDKPET